MTITVQDPESGANLEKMHGFFGRIRLLLDEVITPISITDDGWKTLTYEQTTRTIEASQAAHTEFLRGIDREGWAKSYSQRYSAGLCLIEHANTNAPTGDLTLCAALDSDVTDLTEWYSRAADPAVDTRGWLGSAGPIWLPPGLSWAMKFPATGPTETITVKYTILYLPRNYRWGR